jgi:hypothetical protein
MDMRLVVFVINGMKKGGLLLLLKKNLYSIGEFLKIASGGVPVGKGGRRA